MKNRIFTDTSDFTAIDCGDKIYINKKYYVVTGHASENCYGVEDPKFWVKRAVDQETGERKIIKLTFLESFDMSLGDIRIRCFRDPKKEGEILELVQDHPYFMQGEALFDSKGNNVRILDIILGPNILYYVHSFRMKYEMYFQTVLPELLKKVVKAFEAIRFLHSSGYRHGDIRNDHLIVDTETGNFVWIDFDYDFFSEENLYSLDIFGLGNILTYIIGKGFHDYHVIVHDINTYGDLMNRLEPNDFSLLERHRLVNLKKLYPNIPKPLNNILMHFSSGSEIFYETVEEIVEDLNRCLEAFN